jgi:transposase
MTRLFGKTILSTDQVAWSSEDIVLGYRGQYKLEDGFRTLKDSEACCGWPKNHWTDQKIRVHGFFCVMALLLLSLLQRQLAQKGIDLSITRLTRSLTEIEETVLWLTLRAPATRGKTKGRPIRLCTYQHGSRATCSVRHSRPSPLSTPLLVGHSQASL